MTSDSKCLFLKMSTFVKISSVIEFKKLLTKAEVHF